MRNNEDAEGLKLFAGVDIGSVSTKAALIDGKGKLTAFALIPTGYDRRESGREALKTALEESGGTKADVAYTVATGYGRRAFESDKVLPEIICHARGTRALFPEARTIIDIGGQDSKVIQLDEAGMVARFEMNDKCAAGTGRFLEALTERILNLPIEELGPLALKSKDPAVLSSVCTVFAESEVLSLLSEHKKREDIAYGISKAIARRVVGMGAGGQVDYREPVVFSGGVARNVGVVRTLEEELGKKVTVPQEPQITAALGAALFASEAGET
ncbi:MAG: acyl-CoA dehydratase activase [Dehalococcoidia bacterium]|jgi:predicted CoA-substrate-specific enzyme activase